MVVPMGIYADVSFFDEAEIQNVLEQSMSLWNTGYQTISCRKVQVKWRKAALKDFLLYLISSPQMFFREKSI